MCRKKDGLSKENTFIEWCRKVAVHAEPDKLGHPWRQKSRHFGAASAATEHADSALDQSCYKSLALDLLTNEVWPQQRKDPKYKIRKDTKTGQVIVSAAQRSWINALLRKNLGDNRAAYFILNHGLPALLDAPLSRKALNRPKLQSMVQELMTWHASLLQSILDRQQHPGMADAHKCGAKDQNEWRRHRQEKKSQAWADLREGQDLAKERDSGKRKFYTMSATEQQLVEDYDSDRLNKRYKQTKVKKLPPFHGKKLPFLIS